MSNKFVSQQKLSNLLLKTFHGLLAPSSCMSRQVCELTSCWLVQRRRADEGARPHDLLERLRGPSSHRRQLDPSGMWDRLHSGREWRSFQQSCSTPLVFMLASTGHAQYGVVRVYSVCTRLLIFAPSSSRYSHYLGAFRGRLKGACISYIARAEVDVHGPLITILASAGCHVYRQLEKDADAKGIAPRRSDPRSAGKSRSEGTSARLACFCRSGGPGWTCSPLNGV